MSLNKFEGNGSSGPEELDGAVILGLYTEAHWGEPMPVLSVAEQLAVVKYLTSRGMYPVMGTMPLGDHSESSLGELSNDRGSVVDVLTVDDSQIRTLGYVLKLDTETFADVKEVPGSVFGPYFVGDQYYPEGIAIWRPVEETVTSS